MSETWYMATVSWSTPKIKPVEVDRFNDKSVWIWETRWKNKELRRHNRISDYESYFPTFESAKEYLKSRYAAEQAQYLRQAASRQVAWEQVDNMTVESTNLNLDSLEGRV